ncbi:dermonecrotic toxin domain-containing protein [Pseudomonas gingeri]|uniref:dermonecrotic toxin domain-containing protein n=1 Tax=Pseudomonas gingeri TaxID=117681 RepID=UPI0015A11FC6|nr:DUF6543 domain-containing protein [Pseudomonas gingeri]NWA01687.1 hypothetical protein [Pseudomonas gingeri]NWA13510.1 hypothetical protein [Pseudomonas gingeri]NWA53130.1 hypothetical protein [Pseudomonas gingeri]NWA96627.1 hypothetical protein [Pseudomonas gingeri]NWA99736.1 hypothetical protein [Pseudomonas gingeri]
MNQVFIPAPGVGRAQALPELPANAQLDRFVRERGMLLPDPSELAASLIRQHAKSQWRLDLDPDQTVLVNLHYRRQGNAGTIGQVMYQQTLTQAMLSNYQEGNHFVQRQFPATFQLAPEITPVAKLPEVHPNPLDVDYLKTHYHDYHGIYRRVVPQRYGPDTQLDIDPRDFQQFVWDTDFYKRYTSRQDAYWRTHCQDYRDLLKCALLKAADLQWLEGTLKWEDRSLVWRAAGLNPQQRWHELSVAQIQALAAPGADCNVALLTIYGYSATDLAVFCDQAFGRVVLYIPGNASPLHGFAEIDLMRAWLARQAGVVALRQMLASHFELRDRPDGSTYRGLMGALLGVSRYPQEQAVFADAGWNPQRHIGTDQVISGDVFVHLRDLQRRRAVRDIDLIIRSDASVIRAFWRDCIESAANAAGALALAFPEFELVAGLLGLAESAIGVEQLVEADSTDERVAGAGRVFFGLLNAVPLVARGVPGGEAKVPEAPARALPDQLAVSPTTPAESVSPLESTLPVAAGVPSSDRLSLGQERIIRSHAVSGVSLEGLKPNALGIYQVGEHSFYVRYTDPEGYAGIYEIRSDFKLRDDTVRLIDPMTRKTLGISLRRGKPLRLPGAGLNPQWDPEWEIYLRGSAHETGGAQGDQLPAHSGAGSSEAAPLEPPSPQSPVDSSASDSDSVSSADDYTPYDDSELLLDNPFKSGITLPPGAHFNSRGMIERTDFDELFRVEKAQRVERRGDPLEYGFRSSNFFGGVPKMLDGEVLIVSRTRAGAEAYGSSEFGHGEYQCYRIDAKGLPAVSYTENLQYNADFTRLRQSADDDPQGALNFDEVHVANAALGHRRITYAG